MVRRGPKRDGTDVRGGTFLYLGEVVFMQCLYSLLNMSLLALEFFSPLFNYSFRISRSAKINILEFHYFKCRFLIP